MISNFEDFEAQNGNKDHYDSFERYFDEQEIRKKIFKAAKTGNVESLKNSIQLTLAQEKGQDILNRVLRRRDLEGKYIFQTALINGHYKTVQYLVEECGQALQILNFTLNQDLTILHQALSSAYFLKKGEPEETQLKYSNMIKLLVANKNTLVGAQIDINDKDRLGRTVLHVVSQLGLQQVAKDLLEMGADINLRDLQGLTALHYAIEFKQDEFFKELLEAVLFRDLFSQINSAEAEITLASYCVINQSWKCLAILLRKLDIHVVLDSLPQQGLATNKRPSDYAEECDLSQEYDQLVAWFETSNGILQRAPSLTLDAVLDSLQQNQNQTLLITDKRLLEHAPFLKPQILKSKIEQRQVQPENQDRLEILICEEGGLFTSTTEFSEALNVQFRESTKEVMLADVLKVHDFNYIMKVIDHVKKLEGSSN